MATKKQTPQLITEDDVLAFYDEKKGRGRRVRLNDLWRHYALQPEDVWALIDQQGGECPICLGSLTLEAGSTVGIAIDHEGGKKQGRVRGVLHFNCNTYVLSHLEKVYWDLPDERKPEQGAHEYLTNLPAKKIKVGDSILYDDKIEDRRDRGRPGRICEREGCEKEIPATKPLHTKYCEPKCMSTVHKAKWNKKTSERRRKARQGLKCLFCKKRFDGFRLGQKFCSPECRGKFYNESRRKNN